MSAIHKRPLRKVQSTKSTSDNREVRKVSVPSHRLSPLKEHWLKIYTPIVEHLKLDIRFNVKSRNVEIRNPVPVDAIGSQHLQKAADFVKAFIYGFEVEDALALIRLDNLFVESFEVSIHFYFAPCSILNSVKIVSNYHSTVHSVLNIFVLYCVLK